MAVVEEKHFATILVSFQAIHVALQVASVSHEVGGLRLASFLPTLQDFQVIHVQICRVAPCLPMVQGDL